MPAADRDPIVQLLAGDYPDPETGALLACESRAVAIEDSLDGREVELVSSLGVGDRLALLCDVDTRTAMGAQVERALASRYRVEAIVLPRRPHCDVETVDAIVARIAPCDAIVSVGSGTLNDLGKLVAMRRDVPQLVFGTAPSMNGYTSVSASVAEGGVKRSVRARTPIGVFLDLGVLSAAPTAMIRAGLGDSVCRPTAQADWLLASMLLDPFGQPYREVPFELLRADEPVLFGEARALVSGDRAAMRALARTLVLSGMGMTLCGGSFPASQGEHLVSHYLEMMTRTHALHGAQVGVAAIAVARVQQATLARSEIRVHAPAVTRESMLAHFGARGEGLYRDFAAKIVPVDEMNARLEARWPAIRARIAAIAATPESITAVLEAAGAPTTPSELGFSDHVWSAAVGHAREIRDRYTFLDLAADA